MILLLSTVLLIGLAFALLISWILQRIMLLLQATPPLPSQRSASQWYQSPHVSKLVHALGIAAANLPLIRSFELKYELLLAKARWPQGLTSIRLLGIAALAGIAASAFASIFLGELFGAIGVLLGLPVCIAAFPLAASYLRSYTAERLETIHLDFPYAVDLLTLSLGAGSNLLLSLETISRTYDHHPIGNEVRQLVFDIRLGKPHGAAFDSFFERVPLPEVKMMAMEVIQAEQLGTPVVDALIRLSAALRTRRIQEAHDKAGQARVKIIVPGGLVFLSVLLILFSPIILKAMQGGLDL